MKKNYLISFRKHKLKKKQISLAEETQNVAN